MSDRITFGSKKIPYFENEMDYIKTPNYTIENLCETEKYLLKQKTKNNERNNSDQKNVNSRISN